MPRPGKNPSDGAAFSGTPLQVLLIDIAVNRSSTTALILYENGTFMFWLNIFQCSELYYRVCGAFSVIEF